jgi:hypothetical protein
VIDKISPNFPVIALFASYLIIDATTPGRTPYLSSIFIPPSGSAIGWSK